MGRVVGKNVLVRGWWNWTRPTWLQWKLLRLLPAPPLTLALGVLARRRSKGRGNEHGGQERP